MSRKGRITQCKLRSWLDHSATQHTHGRALATERADRARADAAAAAALANLTAERDALLAEARGEHPSQKDRVAARPEKKAAYLCRASLLADSRGVMMRE